MLNWILNTSLEPLTIFAKSFIQDVCLSSRYTPNMFKERENNCEIHVKKSFVETLQHKTNVFCDFLYPFFISGTFMIPRTTGEGGSYLFNSSLPLPSTLQTLTYKKFPRKTLIGNNFLHSYFWQVLKEQLYFK